MDVEWDSDSLGASAQALPAGALWGALWCSGGDTDHRRSLGFPRQRISSFAANVTESLPPRVTEEIGILSVPLKSSHTCGGGQEQALGPTDLGSALSASNLAWTITGSL